MPSKKLSYYQKAFIVVILASAVWFLRIEYSYNLSKTFDYSDIEALWECIQNDLENNTLTRILHPGCKQLVVLERSKQNTSHSNKNQPITKRVVIDEVAQVLPGGLWEQSVQIAVKAIYSAANYTVEYVGQTSDGLVLTRVIHSLNLQKSKEDLGGKIQQNSQIVFSERNWIKTPLILLPLAVYGSQRAHKEFFETFEREILNNVQQNRDYCKIK